MKNLSHKIFTSSKVKKDFALFRGEVHHVEKIKLVVNDFQRDYYKNESIESLAKSFDSLRIGSRDASHFSRLRRNKYSHGHIGLKQTGFFIIFQ